MSQRMNDFLGILEFRLHFGKAHIELNFLRFSLGKLDNIFNLCEVRDVDLSQRIHKIFILVTYLLSHLGCLGSLPDNVSYRVEGNQDRVASSKFMFFITSHAVANEP